MSFNLFSTINGSLHNLDKSLHRHTKDTNVSDFLHSLQSHLSKQNTLSKLQKLPKDTLFTLDSFEFDFALCEDRATGEMYNIPKSLVQLDATNGDVLKLQNGTYVIVSSL